MERLSQRIENLVGYGAPGKASRLPLSDGVQDTSDPAFLKLLRELHPHGAPAGDHRLPGTETLILDGSSEWIQDRLALLRKHVMSFEKESAPGPSGLRPDHLRDLLAEPLAEHATRLLQCLDVFI